MLLQAEDRAHRIGQACPVSCFYLLSQGTADDLMWPTVNRKLRVGAGVPVSLLEAVRLRAGPQAVA